MLVERFPYGPTFFSCTSAEPRTPPPSVTTRTKPCRKRPEAGAAFGVTDAGACHVAPLALGADASVTFTVPMDPWANTSS